MTGMKDTVHTEYLKKWESSRRVPELEWDGRTVLVIGSDKNLNVGAYVAKSVIEKGGQVIEGDRHDFKNSRFESVVSGATDMVVCCASVQMDWIENMLETDIQRVVHDTLIDPMIYTSIFAEHHVNSNFRKHIVYIGSMAYRQVLNGSSAYCASKAGLSHYAKCAAWELTGKGFTIGMVHPGNIEGTPMTEDTIEGIAGYRDLAYPAARAYWASIKLTDTWLKPQQVAHVATHLLESDPHMSGTQIEMGGGVR